MQMHLLHNTIIIIIISEHETMTVTMMPTQ